MRVSTTDSRRGDEPKSIDSLSLVARIKAGLLEYMHALGQQKLLILV
jgi:hypothetical protein